MKLTWWIAGYVFALAVTLLAPLASGSPDGLERVAEDKGFAGSSQEAPFAVIQDYVVPGVGNEALATILAGFIGVTASYLLIAGVASLLYRVAANRNR